MVNFIGRLPPLAEVLAIPGAHFHDYGKAPRPNRKLGHCTVVQHDPSARDRMVERVMALAR
jgi:5-(carboxyamino)imidazole ribonucleotide synthase